MPTILAHGAVGFTAQKLGLHRSRVGVLIAAILLAMLPDVDALFIGRIPYSAPFGHRGFTHSLFFASLAGLSASILLRAAGWSRESFGTLTLFFALVIASHGFFDAMTDGGLGVAFFSPFSNHRYFFAWRPIPVAPLSAAGLMTSSGWHLIRWEVLLFGPFAIGAAILRGGFRFRVAVSRVCFAAGVAMWIVRLAGFELR